VPILETALAQKQAIPERKMHSIEEFLAKFADVQEVIIREHLRMQGRTKRGMNIDEV